MRSAKERPIVVWLRDRVIAVISRASVDFAECPTRLVALVAALLDAAAVVEAVSAVTVHLAAPASGFGALQLEVALAKVVKAAVRQGLTGLVAGGDSALGVLGASLVDDSLTRTAAEVAGADGAEAVAAALHEVVAVVLAVLGPRHGTVEAVFDSEDLGASIWHWVSKIIKRKSRRKKVKKNTIVAEA